MAKEQGVFIVLEGGDRAGKTTQAKALCIALKKEGEDVEELSFPRYYDCGTASMMREIRSNPSIPKTLWGKRERHLLFALNRFEAMEKMNRFLNSGKTIVCDRYHHSGVAYSVANGLEREWCETVEQDHLEPDLIIYLRVPAEEASSRRGFGTGLHETTDFQKKVTAEYDKLLIPSETVKIVDGASKSREEVAAEILALVQQLKQ